MKTEKMLIGNFPEKGIPVDPEEIIPPEGEVVAKSFEKEPSEN